MKELDVFINGETMNLCIPTEDFARNSRWYSWFNDANITRFLQYGMFPNTPEGQVEFFNSKKASRLILIISNKNEYMGVISLSNIDLIKKICQIALVVDCYVDRRMAPFIALEAMAKMTEHGFRVLGLNRIEGGEHVKLGGFQKRMALFGWKLEGLHINNFVKGREIANSVSAACLYEDYQKILNHRGCLWDSLQKMKMRIKQLPRKSFVKILSDYFLNERDSYYEQILLL
jgi:hypothetical protein